MLKMLLIMPVFLLLLSCATVIKSTNNLEYELEPKIIIDEYESRDTVLGEMFADKMLENPGASGALFINIGTNALTHRMAMVRMAQHTIEMQTYIYKNDLTSLLLLHEMKLAADRGVKVRILLDDNGLFPKDSSVMLMSHHPNIEIRIFNPYKYRMKSAILRYSQFLTDFKRLNSRLHNKIFIVDNSAMVIGGRNISRNYFDYAQNFNFLDNDVLLVGPIAQEGAKSFNEYWNFHMSIPSAFFPEYPDPEELDVFMADMLALFAENAEYVDVINREVEELVKAYKANELPLYWVQARIITDPTAKADREMNGNPLLDEVNTLISEAKSSIYISNAYVVPRDFYKRLHEANRNGAEVHLLTNSLASTDVGIVYAGWINYRDEFVNSGIHVYEFRDDVDLVNTLKYASSSLHSKVMVVDEEYTVIGSLNFDPRSVWLSTEVIVVIESKEFSAAVVEALKEEMSHEQSWEVKRKNGKIVWETIRNGETITVNHIPDTFIGTRVLMSLLSLIVPESLL